MRIEERCSCGAQVAVVYGLGWRGVVDDRERADAIRAVNSFREMHEGCVGPRVAAVAMAEVQ